MTVPPACGQKETASDGSCSNFLAQYSLTKEQLFNYNDDVNLECTNFKKGNTVRVFLLYTRLYARRYDEALTHSRLVLRGPHDGTLMPEKNSSSLSTATGSSVLHIWSLVWRANFKIDCRVFSYCRPRAECYFLCLYLSVSHYYSKSTPNLGSIRRNLLR